MQRTGLGTHHRTGSQILFQFRLVFRSDQAGQHMSLRNRDHAPLFHARAVRSGRHIAVQAYVLNGMHLAVLRRLGAVPPVIRNGAVPHGIIPAGIRGQLAAHRAGLHPDQVVILVASVQDIPVGQSRMNLAHIGLPQGRSGAGTCGFGGQRLIVVMSHPQGARVIPGDSGEEYALLVRVGTGLAADRLPLDLGGGTGSGGHNTLEHIHNHPGRAGGEYPPAVLVLVSVPYRIPVGIGNPQYGNRLLVNAAAGKDTKGDRHLQGGNSGGAQTQAERCCVNMAVIHTHPVQEVHAPVHADHVHQRLGRSRIMRFCHGGPQGFRPGISASAVVGRPAVVSLRVLPSGNRDRHVVNHGGRAGAQLQRGCVYGDRLDGGTDRHLHVRGTVQRLPGRHFRPASHNRHQFAHAVIQHHAGRLRLNNFRIGAVGVPAAENLVGRIPERRVLGPVLQGFLDGLLDLRVNRQLDFIAAGPQLVFHRGAVRGGIRKAVHLQQDLDRFLDRVFDIVRIIIDSLRIGTRFGLQYARRCGILGGFVFFPGDELVFIHAPKHIIRPVVRHRGKIRFPVAAGIEIPPGVVIVRVVGHARQHRALAQGQLLQLLAEEAFGRDLDAVVAFPQVDGVQVGLQDFILGIFGFQLQGQVRFLDLPLVALLR